MGPSSPPSPEGLGHTRTYPPFREPAQSKQRGGALGELRTGLLYVARSVACQAIYQTRVELLIQARGAVVGNHLWLPLEQRRKTVHTGM
jgi:hypothetical protein